MAAFLGGFELRGDASAPVPVNLKHRLGQTYFANEH
jgi:hypothetical protein